mmetsp:Transcript_11619/g.36792  ORF Transcript_11619/g.36792 Transcript_11619/m.36792 type:complete len:98 (+) Transcript_11619:480-773(+)
MLRHALTALTGGRLSVARAVQPAAAWGRAGGGASGGAPAGARGITTEERDKIVEQINDMFIEARDEIEMAVESKDTGDGAKVQEGVGHTSKGVGCRV